MPTRILREGIIDSESVNAVSDSAELLYRRLMSVVDDYGRFDAKPELVRARCFPLQLERWSIQRVADCIDELTVANGGSPLITVYSCGSKKCLQINNFGQRVQSKAKYPGPEDGEVIELPRKSTVDHGDPPLRASRARSESESESESDTKTESKSITAPPKVSAAKRKTLTPLPFEIPPEDWLVYPMEKLGWDRKRAVDTFESMRLWARSKASVYADWTSAWQGWCRRENEKVRIANGSLFPVQPPDRIVRRQENNQLTKLYGSNHGNT